MMIGSIMILLYIVVATICVRWIAKYEGYYSVAFVFSVVALAYGAGIPIELIIRGEENVQITSFFELTGITPSVSWVMYMMTLLSIPCFCFGYIMSGFSALRPSNQARAERHSSMADYIPYAVMTLALLASALISVKYRGVLEAANSSYHLSSELQYTNSIAFLLYYLVYASMAILAAIVGAKIKGWGLLMAGVLWFAGIYLAFFSHERAPLVFNALSIAYVFFYKTKGKGWLVALSAIAAMFLLFVITPIFSMIRSGAFTPEQLIPQLINGYGFSLKNLDPAGPLYSIVMYIKSTPALQLGSTYISQLGVFVPKFIWPDRPIDLSEAFAREYMADWTPGMGFGYSPFAEAILNFGPYFAPLHFMVFGFAWGLFWRCTKFFAEFNNKRERVNGAILSIPFDALYRVAGFYMILMFFRGTFVGVFKELTMILAPVFLLSVIVYIGHWLIPKSARPAFGQFRPLS